MQNTSLMISSESEKLFVKQLFRITDYHMVQNMGFVHANSDASFGWDLGYTMRDLIHHMYIHWMEIFVELELGKRNMLSDD